MFILCGFVGFLGVFRFGMKKINERGCPDFFCAYYHPPCQTLNGANRSASDRKLFFNKNKFYRVALQTKMRKMTRLYRIKILQRVDEFDREFVLKIMWKKRLTGRSQWHTLSAASTTKASLSRAAQNVETDFFDLWKLNDSRSPFRFRNGAICFK